MNRKPTDHKGGTATREDVEDLKRNWQQDPCWDLADTEGFEEYREELAAFQQQYEQRTRADSEAEVAALAARFHCTPELARYLRSQEARIAQLEEQLAELLDPN